MHICVYILYIMYWHDIVLTIVLNIAVFVCMLSLMVVKCVVLCCSLLVTMARDQEVCSSGSENEGGMSPTSTVMCSTQDSSLLIPSCNSPSYQIMSLSDMIEQDKDGNTFWYITEVNYLTQAYPKQSYMSNI